MAPLFTRDYQNGRLAGWLDSCWFVTSLIINRCGHICLYLKMIVIKRLEANGQLKECGRTCAWVNQWHSITVVVVVVVYPLTLQQQQQQQRSLFIWEMKLNVLKLGSVFFSILAFVWLMPLAATKIWIWFKRVLKSEPKIKKIQTNHDLCSPPLSFSSPLFLSLENSLPFVVCNQREGRSKPALNRPGWIDGSMDGWGEEKRIPFNPLQLLIWKEKKK